MRKLIIPGIYRHFKGKMYIAVAQSKPVKETENLKEVFHVLHTEKEVPIIIYEKDNEFVHDSNIDNGELAVYKSLYDDTAYARSLPMFLSLRDKTKYPNYDQEYRMEFITTTDNENLRNAISSTKELFNDYNDRFKTMTDEQKIRVGRSIIVAQNSLINSIDLSFNK